MHVTYRFGEFILDPRRRVLTRSSGEAVTIGAKAFDALTCLVQHAGQIVPREALAKALWPKAVVGDNSLSQSIRELRRALNDAGPEFRYIVTVPRRGYQLVVDVIEHPAPNGEQLLSAPVKPTHSLALTCSIAIVLAIAVAIAAQSYVRQRAAHSARISRADVPDRVILTAETVWPLPPVLECQSETAASKTQRCKDIIDAAKERERRRKLGLQAT